MRNLNRVGRTLAVVVAFVMSILGMIVAAGSASAAPLFQMPFPCGQTWHASTYSNHLALDWNDYPDDNGKTVVASLGGTATIGYQGGAYAWGHYVTINHGNGWQTRYAHLQLNGLVSGTVQQGQRIGYVGNSGTDAPHLHWEQIHNGVRQNTLYANGSAIQPGTSYGPGDSVYTSKNSCAPSDSGPIGPGTARMYNVATNGGVGSTELYASSTWNDWDIVTPIEVDGTAGDELLMYDTTGPTSGKGQGVIYQLSSTGGLGAEMWSNTTWSADWSKIVPVDTDADGTDELLFYASDGTARMYNVATNGGVGSTELYASSTWSDWDVIVPVEVDGTAGDELLMYDTTGPTSGKGRGSIYQLNSTSGLSTLMWTSATWSSGWSKIVPVDTDADGTDELLFYASDGTARMYNVATNGGVGSTELYASSTWSDWDVIVAVEVDDTSGDELLLYDTTGPTSGKGQGVIHQLNATAGFSTRIFDSATWNADWDVIVPVDTDADGTDELLFYVAH